MVKNPTISPQTDQTAERSPKQITVALAGQPNVGKSTVFNMLTGLNQHVGNWPGKTVEQKVGIYPHNGATMRLVDLPGIYSLTANSPEQCIARDYIIKERPDVVIAIIDAAALERNLYLVAELLSLPAPVVLGLNMMDVAEQQGLQIEPHVLEAAMGLPVVPMVAAKNQGVRELMAAVDQLAQNPTAFAPVRPTIRADYQAVLTKLRALLAGQVPAPYPEEWVALKLLEGDEEITQMLRGQLPPEQWQQVHAILWQHEQAILAVVGGRYTWIGRMVRAAVIRPPAGRISLTDRLDRVALHPCFGLVVCLGIFALAFGVTYTLATPVQRWLDTVVVDSTAVWVRQAG